MLLPKREACWQPEGPTDPRIIRGLQKDSGVGVSVGVSRLGFGI